MMNRFFRQITCLACAGLFASLAVAQTGGQPATSPEKPAAKASPKKLSSLELANQKANVYATRFNAWLQEQNQSFEPLLNLGQEATNAILDAANELDDDTLNSFKDKMPGYLLSNHAVIALVPDAAYLARKAEVHGQPQDVAFFKLMAETLNGYWPATQEQLPDMSGCTRFGSRDLVRLYGAWKEFQRQHPKAYVNQLKDPGFLLLADIEDQLLNSQTACDSPEAAMEEFESFIKAYPDSNLIPRIKKRLTDIQNQRSAMRFYQGVKYLDPESEESEAP